MADLGINVRMPKMDEIDGKKAMAVLRSHASEIAEEVESRIEDRTPELTGALKEDETYQVNRGGNELVHWYVGDAYQIAEWKRPYAVYQEGPPLGLSTYTNDPHEMYFKVTTDDLPLITEWAERMVEQAAEQMAAAAEAGADSWEMP